MRNDQFEIFLGTQPGLEDVLLEEALELGFESAEQVGGGVVFQGGWEDVWRANLMSRCAARVLARIGNFRAFHLAQLDKRARKFDWGYFLSKDQSVRVEVVTGKRNKIYHAGAAQERIERAINEELGCPIEAEAAVVIKTRIEDDLVMFSIDTSGEALHKRGFKAAVGKAPMRESMAASFLRACGYNGSEPVVDPMCGSGTFIIEAAEIASGLMPGRERKFAFEALKSFDLKRFNQLKASLQGHACSQKFYGSDRNVQVIGFAGENAQRAGVDSVCEFKPIPLSNIEPPEERGLIIVNPPYGARVGKKNDLFSLYGAFGEKIKKDFSGWRVGLITSDEKLAFATGLKWRNISAPIAHGGLKVKLYSL